MEHLAILDKKRKLLAKILSGEKSIESRWYKTRRVPWDRIKSGETIYFKESGDAVRAKARVQRVLQIELTPDKELELIKRYGRRIGLGEERLKAFAPRGSRYCILIFLSDVRPVKPFHIDKTGFGLMAAWIIAPSIRALRETS